MQSAYFVLFFFLSTKNHHTGLSQNQIKVERTHAFNHFPSVVYSFRKPHTTPRTIPDRSAKLLYLQRLLRTSCCRTATMLF